MVSRGSTKQSEALEGVDKNDIYGMLRFGVDAIFANEQGKPPTDDEARDFDGSRIGGISGGPSSQRSSRTCSIPSLISSRKASAAPISTYVMPAQIADEGGGPKKPQSLKDINAEFQAQILTHQARAQEDHGRGGRPHRAQGEQLLPEEGEQSVFRAR